MKLSALQEYGLRCVLVMAQQPDETHTIAKIAEREGISKPYVAKILWILQRGGIIESLRGKDGGYRLTGSPSKILVSEVLEKLGGRIFSNQFCKDYVGDRNKCVRARACSIRALWNYLDSAIALVLGGITLDHLTGRQEQMAELTRLRLNDLLEVVKA